jgi:hypothetical protein
LWFNIHHYFELAAALAGSYYWLKTKDERIRPFIWYLWLTISVETIALYPMIMQYNFDLPWFIWLKNSPICRNTWLYNIYGFVGLILLGWFYRNHVNNRLSKKVIVFTVVLCSVFALLYYAISGRFFEMYLPYEDAFRTFAILIFVLLYFRELLNSEKFLEFYKSHMFYISIALMLWNICVTPLFIFDGYYKAINKEFVEFRRLFLAIANVLLYTCYVFSFLFSLYHKKQLVLKKSH